MLSRNFPCCHQTSTEQKKAKTYGFASFRALSCVSKLNMVKMVADPDPLSCVLHHPSQRAIPDCKRGDPSNAGQAVLHSHITNTFKLEGEKRSLRINSPPVGCEMVRCAVSAFVFYNQTDEWIDLRVSCQIVHSRNIVSFSSCLFKY